ncbi:MAG: type II secretion system F family protein [Candidatus Micrarchaeota archaeon]
MQVPFSFLPPPILMKISRGKAIARAGNVASTFFPGMGQELIQAQSQLNAKEYSAAAVVASFFNAVIVFIGGLLLFQLTKESALLWQAPLAAAVIAFISLLTIVNYPKIITRKKARKIDDELIPAMRQLLIHVKSGVPLFDALASACDGYGQVSFEFRKMVKQINGGIPIQRAFEDAGKASPSGKMKRVLWQVSNALKVGTDVGKALEEMIADLTREKIDDIKRYGQELSPWTMIYMLAAIVVPSLGITMMLVIISFLGVDVPKEAFVLVLVFITGFQVFFMDFVRSRRPAVEDF